MRLSPENILRVLSLPLGIAVAVGMAVLTTHPYCPVIGLGTRYLCAARPVFAPGVCILCGAVAAGLVILVSLGVRTPLRR